jgi:hypothetical protein
MATEAAANSAQPDEGSRTRRAFWRRIPTPLLITLVGLVLSAWLLPAITRQWDDRQKAHELKSAIVTDMASATAPALIGGEANWKPPVLRPGKTNVVDAGGQLPPATRARLGHDWALASLRIEARLRAYFPKDVVQAWQIYSWLIDRWDGAHTGTAEAQLTALLRTRIDLKPGAANALAGVISVDRDVRIGEGPRLEEVISGPFGFEAQALAQVKGSLGRRLQPLIHEPGSRPFFYGERSLEATLVRYEEEIGAEVLAAHTRGYSTTTGDLLHDLVP